MAKQQENNIAVAPTGDARALWLCERQIAFALVQGALTEIAAKAGAYEHIKDLLRILELERTSLAEALRIEGMPATPYREPPFAKAGIPVALRWKVWERDNFTCHYCGSRQRLAVDHVVAESQGGDQSLDNLVTACKQCNSRKGARSYETFITSILDTES